MSRHSQPLVQVAVAGLPTVPWIGVQPAGTELGAGLTVLVSAALLVHRRGAVAEVFTRAGSATRTAVGRDPVEVEPAD